MKKLLLPSLLIFNLSFLISPLANAQYTKLLDFAGATNGSNPNGDLISVGAFLYGMTNQGGANNMGTIFKIKPDGSGYSKLLDFSGANGAYPTGSLFSDGTFLYGMTVNGGTNSFGNIFKIMPNGTGYADLLDFAGANGSYPNGNLISDGTFLYGMTYRGGTNDMGTILKIMPNGTGYSKLLDFSGTANGSNPYGTLFSDGTFLYGMTNQGGTNNMGVVFKIMPNGTGYADLLDFAGANGAYPTTGTLISDGTFLYGMTLSGGASSLGNIFKIKPDGSGYVDMLDFTGTSNGINPWGSLVSGGTFLYGMTYHKSSSDSSGTLFKIKSDGSGYSNLLNFTGANGHLPYGSLISAGGILYGMTSKGGANGEGVIFKLYDISISATMAGNPICSNQCNSSANTSVTGGTSPFTYSWSTSPVQTTAAATGLCATTYTVIVSDINGSASDTVTIASLPQPTAPSICAITVDSLSKYNVIVWDKPANVPVKYFLVYRDTANNAYGLIGTVPYDSLSMFTDTVRTKYAANGDPNISSWRYKLAVRDTCGNTSAMSPYHQSIFNQNNSGNFNWSQYQIEGQPLPVTALSNYLFQRDNLSNGNYVTIATLSASSTLFTDPQYATYQNTATWRVKTQWSISCTPTIINPKNPYLNSIALNSSRSNVYRINGAGVNEINNAINVSISPNPSKGNFTMHSEISKGEITIYNMMGEKVYSSIINSQLSIINLDASNGIYFLQFKTDQGTVNKKLIINK